MAYDANKLSELEKSLVVTAQLIGPIQKEPNKDNIVEGLDLCNDADTCNDAAQAIREGIFKTVIMGTFNNGKSSIINALIGRTILPEAATPATAIISYIRYGEGDPRVYVHFKDGKITEMTFDEFFQEYKFNNDDAVECRKTNKVSRFLHVDKSIVNCDIELLKNGVQILDSPGLEDKESATKLTIEAARNANAILYTGSAPSGGFNIHDQAFFKANFDGKHLNNVFFIINKSDLVATNEINDVKGYIKTQLHDVFTDINNKFDQELYDKRVFFVSARNALQYKTQIYGENYSERDNESFLLFEKELETFLTTDERSIATFTSCFSKLSNAYNSAQHAAEINATAQSKGIEEVENDLINAERCLTQSTANLEQLKKCFDVATVRTQNVINNAMNNAVQDIENTWNADIEEISNNVEFGIIDFTLMGLDAVKFWRTDEEKEQSFSEAIQPITTAVTKHIENKLRIAIDNLPDITKPIIEELRKDIDAAERKINVNFNELYRIFENNDANNDAIQRGNINPIKLVAAAFSQDINVMVGILAGNDLGWMDFLKKLLLQIFIDSMFFFVLGPLGWIAFFVRELYQLYNGAGNFRINLINRSKGAFMTRLKQRLAEQNDDLGVKVKEMYQTSYNSISKGASERIKNEQEIINTTRERLNDAQFDFETEITRCNYIKNKILSVASNTHKAIFGKELSPTDFVNYSTK